MDEFLSVINYISKAKSSKELEQFWITENLDNDYQEVGLEYDLTDDEVNSIILKIPNNDIVLILVDGFLLFCNEEITNATNGSIFLNVNFDLCRLRRSKRRFLRSDGTFCLTRSIQIR